MKIFKILIFAGLIAISGCAATEPEPSTTGEITGSVSLPPGGGDLSQVQVLLQMTASDTSSSYRSSSPAAKLVGTGTDREPQVAGSISPSIVLLATAELDTTSADASGDFRFTDLETGTYTLYAQGPNTLRAVRIGIAVEADQTTDVGQIALTPTGAISGKIILEGESNHSGAVVFVAGTSWVAFSDAAGDFNISQVPIGTYTVIAAKAAFRSIEQTNVIVTAGEATALGDISLEVAPSIGAVVFEGVIDLPGSTAGGGILVLARALDTDGKVIGTLGSTMTDIDGSFALAHPDQITPSTFISLEAITAGGNYHAFATSTDGLVVGPVSHGVFEVVGMVVGTPEGRSVDHYTVTEIDEITTEASTALATAGTDLADRVAVRNRILSDVGGLIADHSEGTFIVSQSIIAVNADPPDVLTQIDAFYVNLLDGGSELWDIQGNGEINDGTYDSYDGAFDLYINLARFPYVLAGTPEAQIEDGVEVVLGPVINIDTTGIDVTRKIYVSPTESFARFTEILTNNGTADVTVDVLIDSNLGSDEYSNMVNFSSNGNQSVDPEDEWLAMHWDSYDPALAFFFPGASPSKYEDDVEYIWSDVTVPVGETVSLFHWGFQRSSASVSTLADLMRSLEEAMPASYFDGLTIAEASAGLFAGVLPNVVGEAGSVAPLAIVSFDNQTAGTTATVTAKSDGSFLVILRSTNTGDQINVTATDGTDTVIIVP